MQVSQRQPANVELPKKVDKTFKSYGNNNLPFAEKRLKLKTKKTTRKNIKLKRASLDNALFSFFATAVTNLAFPHTNCFRKKTPDTTNRAIL